MVRSAAADSLAVHNVGGYFLLIVLESNAIERSVRQSIAVPSSAEARGCPASMARAAAERSASETAARASTHEATSVADARLTERSRACAMASAVG